jgi:hypothetical protein
VGLDAADHEAAAMHEEQRPAGRRLRAVEARRNPGRIDVARLGHRHRSARDTRRVTQHAGAGLLDVRSVRGQRAEPSEQLFGERIEPHGQRRRAMSTSV